MNLAPWQAYAYLAAWPLLVAGVLGGFASRDAGWAVLLLALSGLMMAVIAVTQARRMRLAGAVRQRTGPFAPTDYQRLWYRLIFGLELASAWRIVQRSRALSGVEDRTRTSRPKSRRLG